MEASSSKIEPYGMNRMQKREQEGQRVKGSERDDS